MIAKKLIESVNLLPPYAQLMEIRIKTPGERHIRIKEFSEVRIMEKSGIGGKTEYFIEIDGENN